MTYNLSTLATRDKPFRVIQPTATIEGQLLRMYTPIIQGWRDSAALMMGMYAARDTDAIAQEDENKDKEIAALIALLFLRLYFTKVEKWHRAKWIANVKAATGVDATWLVAQPELAIAGYRSAPLSSQPTGLVSAARQAVAAARQSSAIGFANLTGNGRISELNGGLRAVIDNATSSALTQARSISQDARNRIQNSIAGGMRVNAPVGDVARDINEGLGKVRARAGRIAENELDNAVKAMTDARMAEAELDEAVWRHYTPRERARQHHLARQGNRYKVDDPVWQELYAPYCRCQRLPVLTVKK